VSGDVAYGGNWFFLTEVPGVALVRDNVAELLRVSAAIRTQLVLAGITGDDGSPIDHIECFGPAQAAGSDARAFVLCPGAAYDRSPCGTGTSAKMAALYKRGQLNLGGGWMQESIVGSVFAGRLRDAEADVVWPEIRGRAFITAKATLRFDTGDPYRYGF
jgi:4-hydroxyproline epimerase